MKNEHNSNNTETQVLNIPVVMHRALQWWNSLPDFGAKNATFDEARWKSKGGLTQIYHPDKFCTELTDYEILKIFEQHGA